MPAELLGAGFGNVLQQSLAVLRVIALIFIFAVILYLFVNFMKFRYILRIKRPTGSGYEVKEVKARLMEQEGISYLRPLRGDMLYKYPNEAEAVSRRGFYYEVELWVPDAVNYFPVIFDKESIKEARLKIIPENIIYFYLLQKKKIEERNARKREAIEKWAPIIAIGIAAGIFIVAMFFSNEIAQALIEAARSAQATCSQPIVQSLQGGGPV